MDIVIDRVLDWREEIKYGRIANINSRKADKLKRENFFLISDADRPNVALKQSEGGFIECNNFVRTEEYKLSWQN